MFDLGMQLRWLACDLTSRVQVMLTKDACGSAGSAGQHLEHVKLRVAPADNPWESGVAAAQMRKAQVDEGTEDEEEACCVSIVCNLLLGLQRGSRRDRVAAKFVENEFEKCDRLMEIFTRRSARVAAAEVCCSLCSAPRAGRHASLDRLPAFLRGVVDIPWSGLARAFLVRCNNMQGRSTSFLNIRQPSPAACLHHQTLSCVGCAGAH